MSALVLRTEFTPAARPATPPMVRPAVARVVEPVDSIGFVEVPVRSMSPRTLAVAAATYGAEALRATLAERPAPGHWIRATA